MSNYSPLLLGAKWRVRLSQLREECQSGWESGRPRKLWLTLRDPEADPALLSSGAVFRAVPCLGNRFLRGDFSDNVIPRRDLPGEDMGEAPILKSFHDLLICEMVGSRR